MLLLDGHTISNEEIALFANYGVQITAETLKMTFNIATNAKSIRHRLRYCLEKKWEYRAISCFGCKPDVPVWFEN